MFCNRHSDKIVKPNHGATLGTKRNDASFRDTPHLVNTQLPRFVQHNVLTHSIERRL